MQRFGIWFECKKKTDRFQTATLYSTGVSKPERMCNHCDPRASLDMRRSRGYLVHPLLFLCLNYGRVIKSLDRGYRVSLKSKNTHLLQLCKNGTHAAWQLLKPRQQ